MYIHEQDQWPHFTWDSERLLPLLARVRNRQGLLLGKMGALGFAVQDQSNLEFLSQDTIKSSEIEGEILDPGLVRSSLAGRLGLEPLAKLPADSRIDGVVEMHLDATRNYQGILDRERLYSWHSALFPLGTSGMQRILVGRWRDDRLGPMEVVSGSMGKQKLHFQAPPARKLEQEMSLFLDWFNGESFPDPVIKAAVAHLWFVTIHPFEDGNGRIARALTDLLLARADGQSHRFYSMSSQIRQNRRSYYQVLEHTQKGGLDISVWLEWFLGCLLEALENSEDLLGKVLSKHHFWTEMGHLVENERQRTLLALLLEGFQGKLSSSKWAQIAKCSPDTALRDIQDLLHKGILRQLPGGGRSTAYELNPEALRAQ